MNVTKPKLKQQYLYYIFPTNNNVLIKKKEFPYFGFKKVIKDLSKKMALYTNYEMLYIFDWITILSTYKCQ